MAKIQRKKATKKKVGKKKTATKKSPNSSSGRAAQNDKKPGGKRRRPGQFYGKDDPRNGGGRPKGALNKTTRAAKQIIQEAFDELGGVPALVAFAEKNPEIFYARIWPRIIPHEITGEDGGPVKFEEIRRVLVDPQGYEEEVRGRKQRSDD